MVAIDRAPIEASGGCIVTCRHATTLAVLPGSCALAARAAPEARGAERVTPSATYGRDSQAHLARIREAVLRSEQRRPDACPSLTFG
jgi:hypothetical protein